MIRFASLRGAKQIEDPTKTIQKTTYYIIDCFVVPPRNDNQTSKMNY